MSKKFHKVLVMMLIVFSLVVSSFTTVFADSVFSEIIAPGVVRKKYEVPVEKGTTLVNVLECDLDNPLLKIELVAGRGKYNQRATVSEMAEIVDATAMVNGDFFNMLLQGTPEGPSIIHGKLESSPCVMTGVYSLGIDYENTAHIEAIKFSGQITAQNGQTFPIDGLNKSYYWYEPNNEYSHQNKIQLYNDFWAAKTRGDKKNTEILVAEDGTIEDISIDQSFPYSVPDGKIIIQADGTAKDFMLNNAPIGSKIDINYDITPNRDWTFLVGGHALLVDFGKPVPYTKDLNALGGTRARTCAGISSDGKKLYIASAEARTKRSRGMSLPNLSKFMSDIGCYKAVNLDGGGSTTMVLKNLGEFERTKVIYPERNGAERPVVNGIAILNTAENTGPCIGIKLNGPSEMLIGESADFSLKSAWDENYKPVDLNTLTYNITDSNNEKEAWDYLTYTAGSPGIVEITATTNTGASGSKTVEIHDLSFIENINLTLDETKVTKNIPITITAEATLKNGRKLILSPNILNYSIEGFDGEFDKNILTITDFNDLTSGKVIVSAGDNAAECNLLNTDSNVIKMFIDKKTYSLNDTNQDMDAAPFIKNSRTMVPIRFIMDAFGGETSWNNEDKIATIKYNENIIEIPIGKNSIIVNGDEKAIDSPALIKENRTFVPVRFVVENLDMNISYNEKSRMVTIIEHRKNIESENNEDNSNNENVVNLLDNDEKEIEEIAK